MTSAKLFMFGQERDLLWVNTNYYRHIASKGDPASEIQGGFLNFGFLSQEDDEVFWHNLTKAIEQETDRMEKGEIRFYSKGDKDLHSRIYKFNDAYIIHICETFEAYGTENMQTVVTLSPAIQNYGIGRDFVKYWQKSYPAPAAPFYYIPEKAKKETKVKTIQLITVLDSGSANDNSGTGTQEGMLYGKTYEFKVVAFTQETPADKSVINWMYKYHSLSENKWIEKKLPIKGETLKFTLNEKDMCGRFVYVRAYIKDAENEGELKVWKHNRFRWFDRKQIKDEVEIRRNMPWLANQKNTSLCGMAAIMYLLAKQKYNIYTKFVLELHRTGYYKFDKYIVDIDKKSKHLLEMNPTSHPKYPNDYKGKMDYCDWITFSSIRDQENNIRDFSGDDDFSFDGATFPNEIKKLMEGILGYCEIIDNTNMIFNKGSLLGNGEESSLREIAKMSILNDNGYAIVILINTKMLKQDEVVFYKGGKKYKISEVQAKKSGVFDTLEHWIVFDSVIGDTISWDEYDFKAFTWGEMKNIIINPDIFSTNYYGYVYGK